MLKQLKMLVVSLSLLWVSASIGVESPVEEVLSKDQISEVIENAIHQLDAHYLYPEQSKKLADVLRSKQELGEFEQAFSFDRFKYTLEAILVGQSGDSNFELLRRKTGRLSSQVSLSQHQEVIESEILEGNIGVLTLEGYLGSQGAAAALERAMLDLLDTDALIIDLRKSDPSTLDIVQQLVSYFVKPGTQLATAHFHPSLLEQVVISSEHSGFEKLIQKYPVYILTSAYITGAWEFFAYTLQQLDKAIVVGDDTIGSAYMTKRVPVSDNINLQLAYAYLSHPATADNWQDDGVLADHAVAAEESFALALELAKRALRTQ